MTLDSAPLRVVIVDDESLARSVLREYLASHADVQIVAECANGYDAVQAVAELAPDLLLLDIQMPKLDGFEVAELVAGKVRLIFVTAHDQFALRAFDYHALDYLLKPYSQQRFDQALAHARGSAVPPAALAGLLGAARGRQVPLARVLIRDGGKVHIIASDKIVYVEAQDDYVRISADGRFHLKNQRLSELESQLDARQFVRVHRSYLINIGCLSQIEQATRDSHVAILHDGSRVPVSKSGYQKVRDMLGG